MTNVPCECQELQPNGETNSSFLVLHPLSGVHTVKTVGSHLNLYFAVSFILFCRELILFCREFILFCREFVLFCRDVSCACKFILFSRELKFVLP